MAYVPTKLYRGVPATGAPVIVYTAASNVIVKSITLHNTTGVPAAVTGTVGTTAIFTATLVPANSVQVIEAGLLEVMANGETITLGQTTAGALTARVMGATF